MSKENIAECREKLITLSKICHEHLTLRHQFYFENINKIIEHLNNNIDELSTDIHITKKNDSLSPKMIDTIKQYVIDEKVKEKFSPYMLMYRMYLEDQYHLT
tara:strand:- start:525 stop:830 length:306 start_codon:yes stop_codon:yes gene_type:complete